MARVRSARGRVSPRLVGAGAAGLAAVFAVAPFAAAAAPSPTPTPSAAPQHPGAGKVKAPVPNADSSTTTSAPVPEFGYTKFRVGVQIKSGAYVPSAESSATNDDGSATAGSIVHIVEKNSDGDVVVDKTCTTDLSTLDTNARETYCVFDYAPPPPAVARANPRDDTGNKADYYYAAPGDTVVLTQTTHGSHMLLDPVAQTRGPDGFAGCDEGPDPDCAFELDQVDFVDPGIPPEAVDDNATTKVNTPVGVDVLSNDDSQSAPTSISVTSQPSDGKAELVGGVEQEARSKRAGSGTQTIEYTPKAGFVGKDEFTYTLTTANGSSLAHVFVTIKAPPPTAVDDSAATTTGVPVTIAETKNDDANGGGALTVKSVGNPHHGTVRVDGKKTIYTSDADFTGKDSYVYTISTAYGTATATVTVTVTAPATPTPSPSHSDQPLAVTGVPTATLGELGIGLLAIGGIATALGRRRRRGNHA